MNRLPTLLVLACLIASARADLVLQQQIVTGNYSGGVTMKIKGVKVRLDLYAGQPQGVSTITDLSTGDSITLMHSQKMFVKSSGAHTGPAKSPAGGVAAPKPPVPRPTGKTEKVGGYDTELYTW